MNADNFVARISFVEIVEAVAKHSSGMVAIGRDQFGSDEFGLKCKATNNLMVYASENPDSMPGHAAFMVTRHAPIDDVAEFCKLMRWPNPVTMPVCVALETLRTSITAQAHDTISSVIAELKFDGMVEFEGYDGKTGFCISINAADGPVIVLVAAKMLSQ